MTEYYAYIEDNADNDYKSRFFNLNCKTLEEAQVDLETHILDTYFGEDRDCYVDQPNRNFYYDHAEVVAVESRSILEVQPLIAKFRIEAKKVKENYEKEKLRKEYERLKAIFEPKKELPKPKNTREAYQTANSKCAVLCEHANECPSGPCQCYSDCYCRHYGSCKNECVHVGGHDWKLLNHVPTYKCSHCGATRVEK